MVHHNLVFPKVEPSIFGQTLTSLQEKTRKAVPVFVVKCIRLIECISQKAKKAFIPIYASGGPSQAYIFLKVSAVCLLFIMFIVYLCKLDLGHISVEDLSLLQKIREEIDHGNYGYLSTIKDIRATTSALEMFFRELKEPMIPGKVTKSLFDAFGDESCDNLKEVKNIIGTMTEANRQTLEVLIKHWAKVIEYEKGQQIGMAIRHYVIIVP